eukprot:TRINITY_DN13762_c0_g1_i1.p1 TRINITY_DN13762_c0_g1~~TRINITY_DN13762_c0_g1_i1.p1  ORF type:complete len:283 (+),score=60.10 TRINITY_DN13762_c0_g1_i1:75-923(+)
MAAPAAAGAPSVPLKEIATKLTENYRDALVATARYFGGERDCIDARCESVARDCIRLQCLLRDPAVDGSWLRLRVPFPTAQADDSTVPAAAQELLVAARDKIFVTVAPDAGKYCTARLSQWDELNEQYCTRFNAADFAGLAQALYTADAVIVPLPPAGRWAAPAAATLAGGRAAVAEALSTFRRQCGERAPLRLVARRLHSTAKDVASEVGDIAVGGEAVGTYARRWSRDRLHQWRICFETLPLTPTAPGAADAAKLATAAPSEPGSGEPAAAPAAAPPPTA